MWEKDKLLVTSNFSFSHSVFKKLLLQARKNQGLFWKGLKAHIWYEGTSHRYTSPGTKVKVICKGQGQISGHVSQKMGVSGASVFHKHILFFLLSFTTGEISIRSCSLILNLGSSVETGRYLLWILHTTLNK